MAVCKLAVLDFYYQEHNGGYDTQDLEDCISMARWNMEEGETHLKYVEIDLPLFIRWAKHKIKEFKRQKRMRQ